MKINRLLLLLLLLYLTAVPIQAQSIKLDLRSDQWKLSGEQGRRIDKIDGINGPVLEVTGNGKYSNSWHHDGIVLIPSTENKISVAQMRFKVRRTSGSGGGMTGLSIANYDIPVSDKWTTVTRVFVIPEGCNSGTFRLGQWMASVTLQFAELELSYVKPISGDNKLGAGESYVPDKKLYSFTSQWGKSAGNYNRMLSKVNVGYNTDRWCFDSRSNLVYQFDAPAFEDGKFYGGSIHYDIGYHVSGSLTPDFSTDGKSWTPLNTLDKVGSSETQLPEFKSGVKSIFVRFKSSPKTNLQLHSFSFNGRLSSAGVSEGSKTIMPGEQLPAIQGSTRFWELLQGDSNFPIPNDSELPKKNPGPQTFVKNVKWTENGTEKSATIRCDYFVSDFYREDFGYQLDSQKHCPFWWCESAYKVTQKRTVPTVSSKQLQISAARNDYESFQLIMKPDSEQTLHSISLSELKSENGKNTIDSKNIRFRKVYYHFVENPTDYTAVRDFYPDALPPLECPVKMNANQNCPIFITVRVPKESVPGDYSASLTVKIEKDGKVETSSLPFKLHVWNFTLPEYNHLETAFGYSPGVSWLYHGAKSDEDRRRVTDLYMRILGEYRISPYNPVPQDPFSIKYIVDKEHPEKSHAEIDFTNFDRAMEKALTQYRFTGYSIPIPGMGGGTFHSRTNPSLNGFGEETIEFQSMFSSAVKQIQDHFEKKGWLDKIYVYWFDEPDPKDYEFVKNGMNRIKKYAPKLRTMLTEEPSDNVIKDNLLGKIDIWCPVTPNFNDEFAKTCRSKGEIFWWYVCCWPHAPYCTEFTDHNAVELRTWLWQTWQHEVAGILVWASNYWTSSAAFPDTAQNPYLDPMCYVSGYSTPPGTKKFWGNGDGRFYYPPLSCAQPALKPVFDEPVPSIRLEMLREGIEDFEMLYLLKEKLKNSNSISAERRADFEKLLIVPDTITKSMTDFATSPQPIYQQREKIAKAIESLP